MHKRPKGKESMAYIFYTVKMVQFVRMQMILRMKYITSILVYIPLKAYQIFNESWTWSKRKVTSEDKIMLKEEFTADDI
jgi:hypothetical protein